MHKEMGPGLLEQVYEECMAFEMELHGLKITRQQSVPIKYKGNLLRTELRYDLVVEDCIVVELKAVKEMNPIFEAQVISYAKLLEVPKAILINFTCGHLYKEGQKSFVNEYFRVLPDE